MGINVKSYKDCPFVSYDPKDEPVCNVNDLECCDLDSCKLEEFGRIIVDWIAQDK